MKTFLLIAAALSAITIVAERTAGADAVKVSAGYFSTCVLDDAGKAWCFGHNAHGELGNGTTTDSTAPVLMSTIGNLGVDPDTAVEDIELSKDGNFGCAIVGNGALVSNSLYCWGDNTYGQIGDGTTTQRHTPTLVQLPVRAATIGSTAYTVNVSAVSAGSEHVCAIMSGVVGYGGSMAYVDHGVACWGLASSGQIGSGYVTSIWGNYYPYPNLVTSGPTSGAYSIAAGWLNSCALYTVSGVNKLSCWGTNSYDQNGSATQVGVSYLDSPSAALTGFTDSGTDYSGLLDSVQIGNVVSCATSGKRTWCWGDEQMGELGNGVVSTASTPTPQLLAYDTVAAPGGYQGFLATMRLTGTNTYTPYSFGDGGQGEMGNGTTTTNNTWATTPTVSGGIAITTSLAGTLSAGGGHTCFIAPSGSGTGFTCWGNNDYGQLGNGTTTNALHPILVSSPPSTTWVAEVFPPLADCPVYTEAHDGSNDYLAWISGETGAGSGAENTGWTVGGDDACQINGVLNASTDTGNPIGDADPVSINCGTNTASWAVADLGDGSNHFDPYYYDIDVDTYQFNVKQAGDYLFEALLHDNSVWNYIDHTNPGAIGIWISNAGEGDTGHIGGKWLAASSDAVVVPLEPGNYQVDIEAYDNCEDLKSGQSEPYQILIEYDGGYTGP